MKYLYEVLIAYLVLSQVGVDATIEVYNILNQMIFVFQNSYATSMDSVVQGYIEEAKPPDACTHIAIPKFKPTGRFKNIVLINGTSKCDFMTKIKYAKEVGYEAAVLFDPFPEPFTYSNITFPFPRSEIDMSVILVSYTVGISIRNYFLYPNNWVSISAYDWVKYAGFGFLAIFGLLLGAIVAVIICAGLVGVFRTIREKWRDRFENSGTKPLLTSTHDRYSSTRTGDNGGTSSATYDNPLHTTVESSNVVVGAQGTVNSVLGKEDTQTLIV